VHLDHAPSRLAPDGTLDTLTSAAEGQR
jgi:hypothetical protein